MEKVIATEMKTCNMATPTPQNMRNTSLFGTCSGFIQSRKEAAKKP